MTEWYLEFFLELYLNGRVSTRLICIGLSLGSYPIRLLSMNKIISFKLTAFLFFTVPGLVVIFLLLLLLAPFFLAPIFPGFEKKFFLQLKKHSSKEIFSSFLNNINYNFSFDIYDTKSKR